MQHANALQKPIWIAVFLKLRDEQTKLRYLFFPSSNGYIHPLLPKLKTIQASSLWHWLTECFVPVHRHRGLVAQVGL